MTSVAAPRPALAPRLLAAPAVTAAAFAALAVAQLVLPAQSRPFTLVSDYVIEWSYAAALWAGALAVAVLHRAFPRGSRLGTAGAVLYALGHVLVGTAVTVTAIRGDESLPLLFMPGLLAWLAGGVLCAVTAYRSRVLPRPLAVALGLSLPLTMALGHPGPLVEAAVWLTIAATLARRA